MKRLGIIGVGLALTAVAATVFVVWPVVGDAPWMASGEPTPFRLGLWSAEEAAGQVRGALPEEPECITGGRHVRWAAIHEEFGHCWTVGLACREEAGQSLLPVSQWHGVLSPFRENTTVWRVCEDDDAVIPLTDLAADLMRPSRE